MNLRRGWGGPACRPYARWMPVLLGLLFMVAPLRLSADALSQLPPAWQGKLQAVPEPDISGTEPVAREAIAEVRERLAGLLQAGETDTDNLAEGYGKLGALYHLFDVGIPARLCWENARVLQPSEFRWPYFAAWQELGDGRTDQALELFMQARELDPDYPPLKLRLGQLWLDTDALDKSQAALQAAAAEPGLRAAALYYLGRIDLLKQDYRRAVERFNEALDIDPEATGVHYPLAQAYRHLGEEALAREHLGQFEMRLPAADDPLVAELKGVLQTAQRHFGRGMKAIMQRDYAAAVEEFQAGLEIDPDNLNARVSYARALFLDGQAEAAETQLKIVLETEPTQVMANFFLALLREAAGEREQAAELYRFILKQDPEHEGAHYYLANLLFRQEKFPEAAQEYRAALDASAQIPPARLLELVALQRAGKPDRELAAELERRIREYPDQQELKYALARLYSLSRDARLRDGVKALKLANQLAPVQPSPPNIAVLALAAAADGQFDQAASLQQQLLDMPVWMLPAPTRLALQDALDAYHKGVMPEEAVWPEDDPMLSPVPFNPDDPFRDYPAAVPF
jgi:tetratricopeptide (TPR) repeat protein